LSDEVFIILIKCYNDHLSDFIWKIR